MRKTRSFGAILVTSLLVAACSGGATTSSSAPSEGAAQPSSDRPSGVPAAGQSLILDRIYQAGEIKVGVLAGPPWLVQSTGGGDPWSGSSWTLAQAVSKAMGLPLKVVDVGQDTKVTSVQTGSIDISITSLSVTPERQKVVDFVEYSKGGFCWFALASNSKVNTIADFEKPGLIDAEVAGGAQMQLIPAQFPSLEMLAYVTPPGEYYALEPILSGRADIASFDNVLIYQIQKQYPQLKFIPSDPAECVANPLIPGAVGWAIQKDDPVFKSFLEGILKPLQAALDAEFGETVIALGQ